MPGRRAGRDGGSIVRVLLLIALATAAAVTAAGHDGFWLCLPGVMLGAALADTRPGVVLGAAVVLAAACAPATLLGAAKLPPAVLVVLVPAGCVVVLVGLRERLVRDREQLRDAALRDALTGVANRRLLLAHADYEIERHSREHRRFALVMLDLDGFKQLNDRFGHPAGDEILRDVAAALAHGLRAQDTIARLGGDEFFVLAPETDRAGTGQLAARITRAVGGATSGVETVRASLGIAVFPEDGRTATTLLQAADDRLLEAKRERHARARRRAA